MRVIVLVKQTEDGEAGAMPSEQSLAEMGVFNAALVEAGVMLAGEGLHPSSKGKRVRFTPGGEVTVTDGPFSGARGLVAGFWLWQVASMDEAVAWAMRMPNPGDAAGGEVEIRQLFEDEDFGDAFTPELREQEARLRTRLEASHE